MRRIVATLIGFALTCAACGDDAVSTDPPATLSTSPPVVATTVPATIGPTTPATEPSTTVASSTSTTGTTLAAPPSTGAPGTGTTIPEHPVLPTSMPRDQIPWAQVDRSWVFILFSTEVVYLDMTPPGEELVVAYLVAPDGTPYAITHWPLATAPSGVFDVRPDGKAAVLGFDGMLGLLDLEDGDVLPVPVPVDSQHATFTRPTGSNYVALAPSGVVSTYNQAGSYLATLGEYPYAVIDFGMPQRPWIYGPEGLDAVINGADGPVFVSNQGDHLRDLEAPGTDCFAVTWWSDTDVLLRCSMERPGYWDAHTLWIVDAEGRSAPRPLTTVDDTDPEQGHDGFVDALRVADGAVLMSFYAVGSGWYPAYFIEPPAPPTMISAGDAGQLVAAGTSTFASWGLGCCGEVHGYLAISDFQGNVVAAIGSPDGIFGVIDAHGVGAP